MKMKEFGPPGGARVPGAPPWIRQLGPQIGTSDSILEGVFRSACPRFFSHLYRPQMKFGEDNVLILIY